MIDKNLYFINAHRDKCVGTMVAEKLGLSNQEIIDILKKMISENLIAINGTQNHNEENLLNDSIIITGEYSDARYSDIYQ
jgi:hypothetical protein